MEKKGKMQAVDDAWVWEGRRQCLAARLFQKSSLTRRGKKRRRDIRKKKGVRKTREQGKNGHHLGLLQEKNMGVDHRD